LNLKKKKDGRVQQKGHSGGLEKPLGVRAWIGGHLLKESSRYAAGLTLHRPFFKEDGLKGKTREKKENHQKRATTERGKSREQQKGGDPERGGKK